MTAIRRTSAFLLLIGALTACDQRSPAEVRTNAQEFPIRASWSAAVAPVGSGTLQGSVTINEYHGSRMDVSVSVTGGAPSAAYQWRIFRGGDCSVNVAATNATAGNGLFLFATIQSYPDLVADGTGAASLTRTIAGTLDPQRAYSIRIRPAQTATNWNGLSAVACGNLRPF